MMYTISTGKEKDKNLKLLLDLLGDLEDVATDLRSGICMDSRDSSSYEYSLRKFREKLKKARIDNDELKEVTEKEWFEDLRNKKKKNKGDEETL